MDPFAADAPSSFVPFDVSAELATYKRWAGILWLLDTVSIGLSAYHGYKRHNGSIGAAIGWGLLGGIAPVITPAVAFAQGFGKAK